jgi:hypothetical protein
LIVDGRFAVITEARNAAFTGWFLPRLRHGNSIQQLA